MAWFFISHHKYVADISNRVKDMTGLSMTTAEALQVVNYGIGGYYDTHFDYAESGVTEYERIGNRVATVLFYVKLFFDFFYRLF